MTLLDLLNIEDKFRNMMVTVVISLFVLVAGLRYETGVDWLVYESMLRDTPPINEITDSFGRQLIFSTPDYGFCILMSIVRYFGGSIQVIFFIVSCLGMLFIYRAINIFSDFKVLSLLIYFSLFFFILDMSGLRQGLSLSIFFFSIQYIYDRKLWKYILIIFVAASFHWSAYLLLPIYFIANVKFRSLSLVVFFTTAIFVFLFQIAWLEIAIKTLFPSLGNEVVAAKLLVYTTNDKFSEGRQLTANTIASILFYISTFVFCIVWRKKLEDQNKYFPIFLNLYVCQIFAFFCLYEFIEMADRLRLYFLIANLVIYPCFIALFRIPKERIVSFSYVGVFAFFSCMPYILNSPMTIAYFPYQNYLIYKIFNLESDGTQRLQKHAEIHE